MTTPTPDNKKRCTKCKKTYPYTDEFFTKCKKTKSGLAPKCKSCHAAITKAYMRSNRLGRRMKRVGLYNGRLSKLTIPNLNKSQLIEMCFEVLTELSKRQARCCPQCELYHNNGHRKPRKTN